MYVFIRIFQNFTLSFEYYTRLITVLHYIMPANFLPQILLKPYVTKEQIGIHLPKYVRFSFYLVEKKDVIICCA
jgi:hypothetical protein